MHRYRNTMSRYEAKCKLEYNNGDRVNRPCPWQIAVRQIPGVDTMRVLRTKLHLTSHSADFHSVTEFVAIHMCGVFWP